MKNEGFSLRDFLIILGGLFLIFLVLTLIIRAGFSQINKTKITSQKEKKLTTTVNSYSDLEKKIKRAAERYENKYYKGTLNSVETEVLSYSLLRKEFLKEKLIDINNGKECSGYVVFEKNGARLDYTPYIKCSGYVTNGYVMNKEDK